MREATDVAPVARSPSPEGSVFSMNFPGPGTFTRKPGFAPFGLPWSMGHEPSCAVSVSSSFSQKPRVTSSTL